MDWTLIKFVPSHPFLGWFAPFLNLCRLSALSTTPVSLIVDWPPKLNWPVNEESLDKVLWPPHRVQGIEELLTCSDSWLVFPRANGLQFGLCHCVLAFVWLHKWGSEGKGRASGGWIKCLNSILSSWGWVTVCGYEEGHWSSHLAGVCLHFFLIILLITQGQSL